MGCHDYIDFVQNNHWDIWEVIKYLEFEDQVDISIRLFNKAATT